MTDEASPRWLDPEALARYLSVRTTALPRLVRQHRIPAPTYLLGPRSPRWDRFAIDSAFDGTAASTDPHLASQAIVAQILSQSRKNG
jgi:hypothetical protein